ncbi:hypothetical protein [Candidatus Magnetaquicoccus inordinatus]|uniref:hypothetical protein n=1 Tax=Candidatus Magnetaquicoccus inordinatus TaxID=2496818 RepID=UPI00102AB24D|nr:hypothetical protein [Candidatus Magnetaquicoccus inordinatus]
MRISKIITSFMFAVITNVSASSLFDKSDVANIKLPSSFVENGVIYTTPALQGMQSSGISFKELRDLVEKHLPEARDNKSLRYENIQMLFSEDSEGSIKLNSVFRWY